MTSAPVPNRTLDTYLLSRPFPSFIYLHHPHHPSTSLPLPALPVLKPTSRSECAPGLSASIRIDVVEYNTPRLLYTGILKKLRGSGDGEDEKEVYTFDGFSLRLRAWWAMRLAESKGKGKEKDKENPKETVEHRAKSTPKPPLKPKGATATNGTTTHAGIDEGGEGEEALGQVVIMITKAERLRLALGNGWSVITRLAELTGVPCSVVLCSTAPWDHVRPHRGDAPEPVQVYLEPPSREDILSTLLPGSSHPLYPRFLDLLLSTVLPLVTPPIPELHYLSLSLWPIYTSTLPPHREMTALGLPYPDPSNPPPELGITIKLLTDLKSQLSLSLAAAIESLLPRHIGSTEFIQALAPGPMISIGQSQGSGMGGTAGTKRQLPKLPSLELPLIAKFLLVAAYAASYNPPKSDVRLFGRGTGPDGKRKKGGGTRRAGYGRTRLGKVPQRLLGPKPFPIDRLLALFSSLYAEHAARPEDLLSSIGGEGDSSSEDEFDHHSQQGKDDMDAWISNSRFSGSMNANVARQIAKDDRRRKRDTEREKKWDLEVESLAMGTKVWSMIPELESQNLIRRTSPPDRLDNITLRCEVGYETVQNIAKELRVTLDEYLYEAAM